MASSVLDVFALLGDLSGDPSYSGRIRARAEGIVKDDKGDKEARLTAAYLESESELLQMAKGKVTLDGLRRQAASVMTKATDGYPAFRLLFLAPEPQLIALSSALVSAYAARSRAFFGRDVTVRLLETGLAGTPWEEIKIDPDKGIVYNMLRMRSVAESGEIVSTLFENWYARTRSILGDEASRRLFERSYRDVEALFGFVPMMKALLGAAPKSVLWADKVKRLHELESQTVVQARDIRAADVDLMRQAEQLQKTVDELEKTRQTLEAVSKARSEFIDVVSHQFRTPLSSIRWNGELLADALADKKIPEEFSDAVETVRQRSVYLIETLDRVFATLEIETGTLVIDAKPAFLWEIVQDAYGQLEKDIERNGIKWKFDRPKDQPRQIPIDKVKIATAMKIVVGNAVIYSKKGGKIYARISDEKIDGLDYQVVTITDEGIGIPKEDQERIFEKFFRSQPSVLAVADGTGLGMFIVKNFVEAHRGKVWVKSAGEGKGTTVALALPVR
ncbi:MAG TPA: HAMP domain-containing sensor histidine kinase [Candidatus Baltobacteraceae bacterium]|nr:HAMP domain-containing sensor histidine kinase [Candidatus Baltobacteraceae bacterium]